MGQRRCAMSDSDEEAGSSGSAEPEQNLRKKEVVQRRDTLTKSNEESGRLSDPAVKQKKANIAWKVFTQNTSAGQTEDPEVPSRKDASRAKLMTLSGGRWYAWHTLQGHT